MGTEAFMIRRRKKNQQALPELFAGVTDMLCKECQHEIKRDQLVENLLVCPECGFHIPMHPYDRIATLVDEGSFKEFSPDLTSRNPISLSGYEEKISQAQGKSGINDAVVTGTGKH